MRHGPLRERRAWGKLLNNLRRVQGCRPFGVSHDVNGRLHLQGCVPKLESTGRSSLRSLDKGTSRYTAPWARPRRTASGVQRHADQGYRNLVGDYDGSMLQ